MKKLVIVLMAAATVFALTGLLFLFAAKEKNAASTAAPVTTPAATIPAAPRPIVVAPTATPVAQPTTVPTPRVLTAEELVAYATTGKLSMGIVISVSGVVKKKIDGYSYDLEANNGDVVVYPSIGNTDFLSVERGNQIVVRGELRRAGNTIILEGGTLISRGSS